MIFSKNLKFDSFENFEYFKCQISRLDSQHVHVLLTCALKLLRTFLNGPSPCGPSRTAWLHTVMTELLTIQKSKPSSLNTADTWLPARDARKNPSLDGNMRS